MEISWTDRVRDGEVLLRVKEQRNILDEKRLQASYNPPLFVRPHGTTLFLSTKYFHEIFHLRMFFFEILPRNFKFP